MYAIELTVDGRTWVEAYTGNSLQQAALQLGIGKLINIWM